MTKDDKKLCDICSQRAESYGKYRCFQVYGHGYGFGHCPIPGRCDELVKNGSCNYFTPIYKFWPFYNKLIGFLNLLSYLPFKIVGEQIPKLPFKIKKYYIGGKYVDGHYEFNYSYVDKIGEYRYGSERI